jgi:glycerophosphoryl diester phosphodiesterase
MDLVKDSPAHSLPLRLVSVLWLVAAALAGCRSVVPLHPFILSQRRPIIFAHRGGGGTGPEATLPVMLATHARNPAAVIEFDVHLSRDGQLVVLHDDTVDRTTNGTGKVTDLTLPELEALDAGYCATPDQGDGTDDTGTCHHADPIRFPFRGKGYVIPTLRAILAALPPETFMSVEVKQPGIERAVSDALRATGHLDRMVVGSANDDEATRIRSALPRVAGYLPVGAAKCFVLGAKAGLGYAACPIYAVFASPLAGGGLALDTRGVIGAAHDVGMAVVYWTINDAPTMERLFRLGADGIYTDYPDRARMVLDRLRGEGAAK